MKKKHLRYSILFLAALFVLGWAGSANAFTLYVWQTFPPTSLQDESGVDLPMGCYVQMIWDAGGDGIDDPMEYIADGGMSLNDWIAAGCPPVDDDVFVQVAGPMNVESSINVMAGHFYEENVTPINPGLVAGEDLYTRFFTDVKENVGICDWYGESALWPVPTGETFAYYVNGGPPYMAHTHIVPEPSVFFLLCGSLLLVLIKRRK